MDWTNATPEQQQAAKDNRLPLKYADPEVVELIKAAAKAGASVITVDFSGVAGICYPVNQCWEEGRPYWIDSEWQPPEPDDYFYCNVTQGNSNTYVWKIDFIGTKIPCSVMWLHEMPCVGYAGTEFEEAEGEWYMQAAMLIDRDSDLRLAQYNSGSPVTPATPVRVRFHRPTLVKYGMI